MPFESLIEFITTLMTDYLYLGVFLAALIETIIPPIPTMAVFPTAGFIASQNGLELPELFLLGIVGGLGASIGSTVIYLIALKLGRTVLLKYLKYVKVSEKKIIESRILVSKIWRQSSFVWKNGSSLQRNDFRASGIT